MITRAHSHDAKYTSTSLPLSKYHVKGANNVYIYRADNAITTAAAK